MESHLGQLVVKALVCSLGSLQTKLANFRCCIGLRDMFKTVLDSCDRQRRALQGSTDWTSEVT